MLKSILTAAAAVCLMATAAASMTVTPRAPGGIFVAGKQLAFDVTGAKGKVTYKVANYFGVTTSGSQIMGSEISLRGFRPGWYMLTCTDEAGSVNVPVGVVMDRGNKPLPEDGRVCSDAASAWLISNEAYRKPFAQMIRLAGIPWVRERLSWPATEPSKGKIDWAKYQAVADSLSAEGIRICQVFHQTPDWAMSGAPNDMRPRDLRDLYRYMKTAAGHFRKQIPAWEVWNEVDIDFWPGLGDSFAGVQKAAYLGIKAGNPDALVLQSSLSHLAYAYPRDAAPWLTVEHIYENDIDAYFDVFNWHSYLDPKRYAAELKDYRALMEQHHYAPRQAWLTECGSSSTDTEPPDHRLLTAEAQRRECRFLSQSVVMGLATGTEKHFWFVMPDYMEGKNQFGILRPDLLPYPGFVALSAAANILGQSDYIGQYKPQGSDVTAHVFKTPGGNVLAAWSDKPTEISLPTEKRAVEVADCFGAKSTVTAKNGRATVNVGPETVYVLDIGNAIVSKAVNENPPREKRLPANKPSKIVLVGRCDLPIDRKGKACYTLSGAKTFDYVVEAYCFDENAGASGAVEVVAPTGWQIAESKRTVKLDPMGREELRFHVTPASGGGEVRISAYGKFGSPAVSPTVSRIR
jgi:hypothetical protein